MAQTIDFVAGGNTYKMRASLEASRALAKLGIDPLLVTLHTGEHGSPGLTGEQVIDVIYTGIRHGGGDIDRDAVGQLVYEKGLVYALRDAANYIGAMVTGTPEKPIEGDGPKKN